MPEILPEYEEKKILVFPNPTSGTVHIPNSDESIVLHDAFDNEYVVEGDGVYNLSELNKGVYFLQLENETIKIIKQ